MSPITLEGLFQGKRRRRTPQVSHNSAVRTPSRQVKQTTFCWPFKNLRAIEAPPISIRTSTKFLKSQNHSPQLLPIFTESQRRLNCFKFSSKHSSKMKSCWLKSTKTTCFTLSRNVVRCRRSETSAAQLERTYSSFREASGGILQVSVTDQINLQIPVEKQLHFWAKTTNLI